MSTSINQIPAFPSVLDTYTWTNSYSNLCLSTIPTASPVWGSLCPLPNPSVYCSGTMDQPQPSPAPEEPEEFQAQLELFQKLGFSQAQVRAVLLKLGLHTDTNRVLGELVQAGVEMEEKQSSHTAPVLVSRGDGSIKSNSSPSLPTEQEEADKEEDPLRPVVIDGSNVAMSHGNKEVFSCLGIQLAVKYFLDRGHEDITVFVPSWRREQPRADVPITDQHILRELEKRKFLVFTPSRRVAGKRVVCYDDRFIVKLAYESDGIIVSNDTYRDLQGEKPEWKRFIEERLLMYSFVNDKFMPPDDPLGRHGPTLDNFLRKTPRAPKRVPCPYGKKCTYGIKCKFSHPERTKQSHRSLADELRDKAKLASSPHKPSSSGPGSASLEEVMEQKLSLDLKGTPKKVHTSENVPVLKSGLQSTQKRFSSKRERPGHCSPMSMDSIPTSQEPLDSGLGSYECKCGELHSSICGHKAGGDDRNHKPQPGGRHQYPPSNHQMCSSCQVKSLSSSTGQQLRGRGLSTSQNPGVIPYFHSQYNSYGGAPSYMSASMPYYSFPQNYRHSRMPSPHEYWSEVYGGYQSPSSPMHGEVAPWGPEPPKANPVPPEREQVRKKLRAVFNARLVDRAMDMFPNVMDPQKLAVEIINLQSYEGIL